MQVLATDLRCHDLHSLFLQGNSLGEGKSFGPSSVGVAFTIEAALLVIHKVSAQAYSVLAEQDPSLPAQTGNDSTTHFFRGHAFSAHNLI